MPAKTAKPKPSNRDQRKANTRARLLAAAAKVFSRRGFNRASVSEVAGEAGYTVGAVYAHFSSKEEMFLALFDQHVEQQVKLYTELYDQGATLQEQASRGADRWMALLREQPDFFPLSVEFWAHAVRDERLRERYAHRLAEFRKAFASMIDQGAREHGFPVDADTAMQLGTVVNALGNGLAMEKLADPDAVSDELLGRALSLFFEGLIALARAGANPTFGMEKGDV